MRELARRVDQYHGLPEDPSLKWVVGVNNLGTASLVLNVAE